MARKKLNKTHSSFSADKQLNRAEETRRDNDVIKTPKIEIEDIDWAILSYLQDVIKPVVTENGKRILVPVMYASGEKWAQVQARGYMRDAKGKIMTPVITLRRTSIVERDQLKKLDVNINPAGNELLHKVKYTKVNKYDKFSVLQNTKPVDEYYTSAIPEFVDVSYELLIWTELTDQMNDIMQQIMPTGGFAWGTTYKFPTFITDYPLDVTNVNGEDRLVRSTLQLTVKGTLLFPFELQKSNIQKRFSVKRVVFGNETEAFDVDVDSTNI